ncbi:30S ribosome-binding factor RbfA [Candidatus Venteria ishoeyi]|uniref:Ribosome-binding factor A n=1 Tax=Candidatus Venteria ishoeyi TaxID=1899563 RepID=A0A1H6F812_9GAMM|nr:30S ribosome-binding factor RbfA [Candidatus Venteria ishoeyi]MDM8548192.1 30S ribosome-binding factor RbfA [Candidatus Venteria ishoeyi]SEH06277.1 Ribosome-binding factor A [Candidatus Venteria ishoeyi]
MAREFTRAHRVGEMIQRELAQLIQLDRDYTASGIVTIAAVDVSPDLRQAKVYITVLGDEKQGQKSVDALNAHDKTLRHLLSQRMRQIRTTPKLQFIYDYSIEYGNQLSALIESVSDKNEKPES